MPFMPRVSDDSHLVVIIRRVGTLVNDIVMLGLTWAKTYSIRQEALSLRMNVPLSTLLVRDGMFLQIRIVSCLSTV